MIITLQHYTKPVVDCKNTDLFLRFMSLFHSVFISYDWSLWSHDFLIQGRKLSFQVTCPFSLFCLSGSQADDFPCPNDNFFPSYTFRWPKFPALKLTGVSLDMSEIKFFVIESFFFFNLWINILLFWSLIRSWIGKI